VEGDGWKGMEGEWSRQPCQLHIYRRVSEHKLHLFADTTEASLSMRNCTQL